MTIGEFASHFVDWMPYIISVEPAIGGNDDYGNALLGAAVQMPCQIEEKVRKVMDAQGRDKVSNSTVYIGGGPLTTNDRITMPATFKGPSQPPIINVANHSDQNGFSHSEVYI